MSLRIPDGVELRETSTSVYWIEKSGLLCSIAKKAPPQTVEEGKKELENWYKLNGDRKFCMLADITNGSTSSNKESRDFAAQELPKIVKAMAMISNSPLSRMAVNLFFGLKPPPFPTKIFENEEDARKWIQQYL